MAELDSFREMWQQIENADSAATVFQSWTWNRSWCEHFLKTMRGARLNVWYFEDLSGTPVAILPMFQQPISYSPLAMGLQVGHKTTFHNDLIMQERNADTAEAVINAIQDNLGPTSFMHFRYLLEDSVFTCKLQEMGLAEPQCTRVWLAPDPDITDQYSRLGGKRRKVLRSNERRLRADHEVDIVYRRGDDLPSAFEKLMQLHYGRHAGQQSETLIVGPYLKFLRDAACGLGAANLAEVAMLRVDGKPIAAELYIHHRGHYYGLQSGFDMDFRKSSPIRILSANVIQKGFDEARFDVYDLGPAYEVHKFDWNPSASVCYFACVPGRGIGSRALSSGYHRLFRKKLPEPMVGGKRLPLADLGAAMNAVRGKPAQGTS
jgi:CelD/BcsL family acetyltransferase involved in cellulose biosynthesis